MSEAVFHLDGKPVPCQAGQTIMQAARAAGHYIPHLCDREGYAPHGSCRLCLVRVDGREVSACTQPAEAGTVAESDVPDLTALRRTLVQMLFVEGNHICPACEKSGACTLQAVAYHLGMVSMGFVPLHNRRTVDASHPAVVLDRNRCIQCALCVRASEQTDGKSVFAIAGRGAASRLVVNSPDGRLGSSELSVDDAAVAVCPTGALVRKGEGFTLPIGQRHFDGHDVSESPA